VLNVKKCMCWYSSIIEVIFVVLQLQNSHTKSTRSKTDDRRCTDSTATSQQELFFPLVR